MSPQAWLALDHGVAECGGAVTGTVSWTGNDSHKHVGVLLRYRTQGRGDADGAIVARFDLGVNEAGQLRFRLDVPPDGPVTYHGQLLRLLWHASVRIPATKVFSWRDTDLAVADLTVVPNGWLPRGG